MVIALLVAAVLGWKLLAAWLWPFTACSWCSGTGKVRSPGGKQWRKCWWCKGKASKVRLGRRLWVKAQGVWVKTK